jgi:hypothetical protein
MFGEFRLLQALPFRFLSFPALRDGSVARRSTRQVQSQSHECGDFPPAPFRGQAAKFLRPRSRLRASVGKTQWQTRRLNDDIPHGRSPLSAWIIPKW